MDDKQKAQDEFDKQIKGDEGTEGADRSRPDVHDEMDPEQGSTPAAQGINVLDEAHEVGLYDDSSDEGEGKQEELGVAEEIEKDEKEHTV